MKLFKFVEETPNPKLEKLSKGLSASLEATSVEGYMKIPKEKKFKRIPRFRLTRKDRGDVLGDV